MRKVSVIMTVRNDLFRHIDGHVVLGLFRPGIPRRFDLPICLVRLELHKTQVLPEFVDLDPR